MNFCRETSNLHASPFYVQNCKHFQHDRVTDFAADDAEQIACLRVTARGKHADQAFGLCCDCPSYGVLFLAPFAELEGLDCHAAKEGGSQ